MIYDCDVCIAEGEPHPNLAESGGIDLPWYCGDHESIAYEADPWEALAAIARQRIVDDLVSFLDGETMPCGCNLTEGRMCGDHSAMVTS